MLSRQLILKIEKAIGLRLNKFVFIVLNSLKVFTILHTSYLIAVLS
jgi:hypothetical protein